jgi:glutaredoxin
MLPTGASVNKLPHDQAFCTLHRLRPLFNHSAPLTSPRPHLGLQSLQAKCSQARTSPWTKFKSGCVHRVAAMSAAHAHVEPLTQTSVEVAIITTVGCQFCKRAKDTLKQAGLDYREIEASNQPELLNKIKETTGRRTVPQVSHCPQN